MTEQALTSAVTIATALIGVAIVAVLVSRNAQTGSVISAAGQAFAGDLTAAVSPVVGGGGSGSGFANFGGSSGLYNFQ
jgi:hypothetical protein